MGHSDINSVGGTGNYIIVGEKSYFEKINSTLKVSGYKKVKKVLHLKNIISYVWWYNGKG